MYAYPVTREGWRNHYFALWAKTGSAAALHLSLWYAILILNHNERTE